MSSACRIGLNLVIKILYIFKLRRLFGKDLILYEESWRNMEFSLRTKICKYFQMKFIGVSRSIRIFFHPRQFLLRDTLHLLIMKGWFVRHQMMKFFRLPPDNPLKAPWRDGMHAIFCQKYWNVLIEICVVWLRRSLKLVIFFIN